MAITTAICTSFKQESLQGLHNFNSAGGNVFKLALYTSAATLGAGTTVYSATNEVATGGGYAAGGNTLTNISPVISGTSGIADFNDSTWAGATITANGGLVYNSTNGNRAVATLAFGGDKSSTAGDFTVQFPAPDAANAIVRIGP
jgi:hypothetical protein